MGSGAQMILSDWKFGNFFSVNLGGGMGVTMGCYWAWGISGMQIHLYTANTLSTRKAWTNVCAGNMINRKYLWGWTTKLNWMNFFYLENGNIEVFGSQYCSYLPVGNRARYRFIEVDMSTMLDKQCTSGKRTWYVDMLKLESILTRSPLTVLDK